MQNTQASYHHKEFHHRNAHNARDYKHQGPSASSKGAAFRHLGQAGHKHLPMWLIRAMLRTLAGGEVREQGNVRKQLP